MGGEPNEAPRPVNFVPRQLQDFVLAPARSIRPCTGEAEARLAPTYRCTRHLMSLCLPEISSAACTLRIWRRPGSLRGHGNRVFRAVHRARVGPAEPGGASDRERRRCAINWRSCRRQARGRPRLRPVDRLFWTWLCHLWPGWRHALVIVKPDTVLRWHRRRLSALLALEESAAWPGRPRIPRAVQELIRQMCRATRPGAPRASTASCSSSASRSLKPRSGTTWCVVGPRRPRPGAPS